MSCPTDCFKVFFKEKWAHLSDNQRIIMNDLALRWVYFLPLPSSVSKLTNEAAISLWRCLWQHLTTQWQPIDKIYRTLCHLWRSSPSVHLPFCMIGISALTVWPYVRPICYNGHSKNEVMVRTRILWVLDDKFLFRIQRYSFSATGFLLFLTRSISKNKPTPVSLP